VLEVTELPAREGTMICAQVRIQDGDKKVACRSSSVKAKLVGQKYCGHVWGEQDVKEMLERGEKGNFTFFCPMPKCRLAHVVSRVAGKVGLWIGALI